MSNSGSYYALTLSAQGTNSPAYYALTPTSNLTISQGGVTLEPSSPSSSGILVNIYPQTLQISAPAGAVSAGVTIITSDDRIAGQITISPPIEVATVVTLYGNGGAQLGQAIVDPGNSSGTFSFPISGNDLGDAGSAQNVITEKIGAKVPQQY